MQISSRKRSVSSMFLRRGSVNQIHLSTHPYSVGKCDGNAGRARKEGHRDRPKQLEDRVHILVEGLSPWCTRKGCRHIESHGDRTQAAEGEQGDPCTAWGCTAAEEQKGAWLAAWHVQVRSC